MTPRPQETASVTWDDLSLIDIIVSSEDSIRNLPLADYCSRRSFPDLIEQCEVLHNFESDNNLYHKVRAYFFLYSIHRYHLKHKDTGTIPYQGQCALLDRRFEEAIEIFRKEPPCQAISSALAKAYYQLGFQTLADQVKLSVKNHPGNQWMFQQDGTVAKWRLPKGRVLKELTPVRMDLSHCGWSDIFFLGMDFPEGAKVLNVSVDLVVRGRHTGAPRPPIETHLRVLDEPVLRLTSVDLQATVDLTDISQVFEFAKDYLGLLRAGIIASGIVPPGFEHNSGRLTDLFEKMGMGHNMGLELVTRVNDIPKGSRLAVSTNLLASIIANGMRCTGQTNSLEGELQEEERRLVAARAILGEWLGGSGGGWQDSGGVWPGIKLIQGVHPEKDDPEHGLSRGRLLPKHRQLSDIEAPERLTKALQDSLVLVHGGMAQNVGPVLEMVTEKYLLRDAQEWKARQDALIILDEILEAFRESNIRKLARILTRNFFEPIQTIIPWATNLYTETLIARARERFGDSFWGFWMLGGMSGGGMGFIFDPEVKAEALDVMQEIMSKTKSEMQHALPFAMEPVVYDFAINTSGTISRLVDYSPDVYEPSAFSRKSMSFSDCVDDQGLKNMLMDFGFDKDEHEAIRNDLQKGVIGLKQNRLPADTDISDVQPHHVIRVDDVVTSDMIEDGIAALRDGTVGVVTLAAGVGSRWTNGAGVCKAINPFCKLGGSHRSFLEVHLAKSRRISEIAGTTIPHVITTSYMTTKPLKSYLKRVQNHGYKGSVYQSQGKSIGLRLIPTVSDLKFSWDELHQQKLDEQAQKVRESAQNALLDWAKSCGEGSDYVDNSPLQCLHPVGHYYEIPNLLLNGTLLKMLKERPQLKTLMLHNIDTVGTDVDPGILGLFLSVKAPFVFEVMPRLVEDRGGGLACVNGSPQLVEGLALPREEDEYKCSYYNSMTTWIDIDGLLAIYGLVRDDLPLKEKVTSAVHKFSRRLPTYVTIKDVKKRCGNGHEDVFPVAQFEKLWGDISTLEDVDCQYFAVSRERAQQLKDPAQLDGWLRDNSAAYLEKICSFD